MTHHELADTLQRAYAGIPEEDLRDLIDAVRGLIAASRALGVSVESYLTVADRIEQTRQSEAAKFLVPLEQEQLPRISIQLLGEIVLRKSTAGNICRKDYREWIDDGLFVGFNLDELERLVTRWIEEEAEAAEVARLLI